MIDRNGSKRVPTCDGCGETLPDEETFEDAVAAMRSAGWKFQKVDGEWENYCVECQEATKYEDVRNGRKQSVRDLQA